ncbi:MAG: hypothetical protein KGN79_05280 [Acidobacteriota bacterium]|nr:hypothetical protein [Acidobacteriota bacterium]
MKLFRLCSVLTACALAACLQLHAQSSTPAAPDVWTHAGLITQSQELVAKARTSDGAASIKLTTYPQHFTMLAFRSKTGGAELHAHFADVFIIEQGSATLYTGGAIVNQKAKAPGELVGTSLENANQKPLHVGDIVHIPAGTPHWLVLPKGGTLTYFVIKVKES